MCYLELELRGFELKLYIMELKMYIMELKPYFLDWPNSEIKNWNSQYFTEPPSKF